MKISLKQMVVISLFIAIQIIFTRFLVIETPILRISLTFIPLALCSMTYGPLVGGVAAAIADLIGIFLFSKGGAPFFPGFTFSAFLSGVVYGVFLYKRPNYMLNYIIAATVVCIIINLGLDTLWLKILMDKGYMALIPTRMAKAITMIPIQVIMLRRVWQYLGRYVSSHLRTA